MVTEPIPPPDPEGTHPPDAYSVKERVAVGTAGVVYRAVENATGREVLFKVLMEQSSHPLNGAQVLALRPALMRLRHPRIAGLIDAYQDPEGVVLVYPLVGGIAGNDFPHKGHLLSPDEARAVARQVCDALHAGELAGFPHGDVKPSNLLLTESDEGISVQVQDWGLSTCRAVQPEETLQFMAPERLHGHSLSSQADLFSLGACLWYLVTGRVPVQSHTRDGLLSEWAEFDANTLAGLRPEVDNRLREWLGWLLRWQPVDRPASAAEALAALNRDMAPAAETPPQGVVARSAAPGASLAPLPAMPPPRASGPPAPRGPTSPAGARTERLRPGPPSVTAPAFQGVRNPGSPSRPQGHAPPQPVEGSSAARKFMGAVLVCCAVGALGVIGVWFAEDKWGPEWKAELAASAKGMWRFSGDEEQKYPVMVADAAASQGAAPDSGTQAVPASTGANSGAAPVKPGAASSAQAGKPVAVAAAKPPANKSTPTVKPPASSAAPKKPAAPPPKPVAAEEVFLQYALGSELDGAAGGKGWKGPWKAAHAVVGISPDRKHQGLILGGGPGATPPALMQREIDPGSTFNNGSVAVLLGLWHPGGMVGVVEVDLLGTGEEVSGSPVVIAPEGTRLRIGIRGGTEVLYQPANNDFKLALKWSFRPKQTGTVDVDVQVYLDPVPGAENPVALSQTARKVLNGYKTPTALSLLIRSADRGAAPMIVKKLKLAKTVKEALE